MPISMKDRLTAIRLSRALAGPLSKQHERWAPKTLLTLEHDTLDGVWLAPTQQPLITVQRGKDVVHVDPVAGRYYVEVNVSLAPKEAPGPVQAWGPYTLPVSSVFKTPHFTADDVRSLSRDAQPQRLSPASSPGR